jgi:hypothetical protein
VLRGLEQHALELKSMSFLNVCLARDRHTRGTEALCKFVSDLLELPEVEQPRGPAGRRRLLVEAAHRERRDERASQFLLESRDLGSQSPAGGQLVKLGYARSPYRRQL